MGKDLKKVRKGGMRISGGRAFQRRRNSKSKGAEVFVFGVLRNSKGPRRLRVRGNTV